MTETRTNPVGLRRRRACTTKTCNGRLTTLELVVGPKTVGSMKNGRKLALVSLDDLDELAELITRWRQKPDPIL